MFLAWKNSINVLVRIKLTALHTPRGIVMHLLTRQSFQLKSISLFMKQPLLFTWSHMWWHLCILIIFTLLYERNGNFKKFIVLCVFTLYLGKFLSLGSFFNERCGTNPFFFFVTITIDVNFKYKKFIERKKVIIWK